MASPHSRSSTADARYAPIRDYAVIGDCHGAALVSRAGDVDWCCLRRFDAEPVFSRLLDADRGGALRLRPDGPFESARRYLTGTNVLETLFETADGVATVTDFMPVGRRAFNGTHDYVRLNAPGWLVRVVEGRRGMVRMRMAYRPSADFGRRALSLRADDGVVAAAQGPHLYHDVPGVGVEGDRAAASFEVRAGQRFALVLAPERVARHPARRAGRLLAVTRAFWEEWIAYCRYDGPYGDQVRRSALALKLLTYAPSGAMVAAPTTSLPEDLGGSRNWDYRYCWLRDSAFMLYALAALGYGGEARAFSGFLQRACAASEP
ncbi:MAG TPA: glycoside hydrolase family 15 protein [Pelomicrobium sp.]|nr:glycoside hydrolase family 15 protein [Pelomicrobium sp.]